MRSERRVGGAANRIAKAILESLESRTLLANSTMVFPGPDGRLVYAPDAQGDIIPDFSMVGYKTGNVPLPNTPGGVNVSAKPAAIINPGAPGVDMTATIQAAIDDVSNDSMDANGFRGAVLLKAGNYPISGTLHINAGGVVLMGDGDSSITGTRLEATGTATRFLIDVDGTGSRSTSGSTYTISDSYVPVGARSFHVSSTSGLAVGDNILVTRPSPADWIHDIGMDQIPNPDGGTTQWAPGSKNQNWERTITAISGSTVIIDIPLTNSLDQHYDGGTFKHYTFSGRISQVGISDMYLYSDSLGAGDLAHATGSITMDRTVNGWMHNITSDGFAVNQIILDGSAKFCTIDDAVVQNTTVSSQAPPAGISVNGALNLVENVAEHGVYHAVALTASVPGPNVIYNLTADGVGSDCGPHQRWSTGGLFDNVSIAGNDLQANNRADSGSGHGWAGANYVFWNCTARNLEISSPPTAQNWAIGCIGTKSGDGVFESLGTHVTPTSLYQLQLWDRLRPNPTAQTVAAATPNPLGASLSTSLSVMGAQAGFAESGLTYTWTTLSKPSGTAIPIFGANSTNAAKNSIATLSLAGTYIFQVKISDANGLAGFSNVVVTATGATTVNGTSAADSIRIARNGSFVDVFVNDLVTSVLHQDYATSAQLLINGLGGNDTITVDYGGGDPVPAAGLIVDGGDGSDNVSVIGSSGADAVALASGLTASVDGGLFTYIGAEEMDLALGSGADTLSASGNASVGVTAMVVNLSGGGSMSMAAASTLPSFADMNVNGATFSLIGTSQTINTLNGNGTVNNNANGAAPTLTVGGGTFTGTLTNGAGTLALTKIGPGKLILSGTNSYTGISTLSGGITESGNSASFAALTGQVRFNGGTFHVTADSAAANVANKFTTGFSGATSASTGTFDVDPGVTLTIGGNAGASLQTAGGGGSGGSFIKIGTGTLRIISGNNQQDDPFLLKEGTIIAEHADALGRGDAGVSIDMQSGTTLVLRQDVSSNFQTPIGPVMPSATINIIIDRLTPGAGVTHSLNALGSIGPFTFNLTAGANVTSGVAGLTLGSVSLDGNATFNTAGSTQLTVSGVISNATGPLIGTFGLTKTGSGSMVLVGVNTYPGATTVNAGTLRVNGSIAASSGATINSGGSFIAGVTQALKALTINSGGSGLVPAGGDKVLTISGALTINSSGTLDLSDEDMILDYTSPSPVQSVRQMLFSGRLISSAATATQRLGYGDNAVLGRSVFSGQAVDATSVLVKYTYSGDADLDGDADGVDIGTWATKFTGEQGGTGTSGWTDGDWDYDGDVDGTDAGLWAQAFTGEQGGGGLGETSPVASPSPIHKTRTPMAVRVPILEN